MKHCGANPAVAAAAAAAAAAGNDASAPVDDAITDNGAARPSP